MFLHFEMSTTKCHIVKAMTSNMQSVSVSVCSKFPQSLKHVNQMSGIQFEMHIIVMLTFLEYIL